jgi:hypothetical protein
LKVGTGKVKSVVLTKPTVGHAMYR